MSRLAVASLALASVAGPAHAAEGGGGLVDLLIQAANLALLFGVLVYFARKPVVAFFQDRRARIKGDLDDAAELLQSAETRYEDWQRKLIELETATEAIRSEGLRRAEEEREAILADARAAAERIRRDATAAIAQQLRRAQAELRTEAAALTTEMAQRILEDQLADADRERLIDEFIGRVEWASRSEKGLR
jgi:F-type H+-transporting ATPase subunit b